MIRFEGWPDLECLGVLVLGLLPLRLVPIASNQVFALYSTSLSRVRYPYDYPHPSYRCLIFSVPLSGVCLNRELL